MSDEEMSDKPRDGYFTDADRASRFLRNFLRGAARGRGNAEDLKLTVISDSGKQVEARLVNRNARTRHPAFWQLEVSGKSVAALAPAETVANFFQTTLGEGVAGYDFISASATKPKHDFSSAPLVATPASYIREEVRSNGNGESFDLGHLLSRVYTRFGPAPLARMHLAVEEEGKVQGFVTVEKRARHFQLVDAVLSRRVTLSPQNKSQVSDWLQKDFEVNPRVCIFRVASKEEKDAYEEAEQEEIEVEVEEGTLEIQGPAEQDSDEATTPEPERTDATVLPDPVGKRQKRIHPKNRPKKKTKAQEKARVARLELEEYRKNTNTCLALAEKLLSTATRDEMRNATDPLGELAAMRGPNKARLRNELINNSAFSKLRQLISMFSSSSMRMSSRPPLRYRGSTMFGTTHRVSDAASQRLSALAREMFPKDAHTSPYQSGESVMAAFNNDQRDMSIYQSYLFPEVHPVEFIVGLHLIDDETWVDIGSGRTPENPDSLIRSIKLINPRIKIIGVDNSYSEETASEADKATGRVGVNFEGADQCDLRAGYAQDIPLGDESVETALSAFVFDKFNDDQKFQGTAQALREIARILKPGGDARLVPIRVRELEGAAEEIRKYFDIEENLKMDYSYGSQKDKFAFVLLRKREMSREEFLELKRKSQEWKDTHKNK